MTQPFKMTIQDVFIVKGRGVVVTGQIESGIIKVGDNVELVDLNESKNVVVTGIEKFRKVLSEAKAGENVGILLKDIDNAEVKRGQVLAKPGSVRYN